MNKKGRVLLIGAEDEENLAIRYLGAVLEKEGHEVKISPCSKNQEINGVIRDIKKFKPDLVGISIAFQSLANIYFDLVEKIKVVNPSVHITVGGHFPTFEYAKILETQKGIDSVIRFEGEIPIVQLINSLIGENDLSKVSNLVYRENKKENNKIKENSCLYRFPVLDELPFPLRLDKAQIRLGERFATVVASRGCFYSSCLYCCIGAFHSKKEGKKYSLRTPDNVASEISELYHKQKIRLFQFHDDNFMLPSKKETIKRFQDLKLALEDKNIDLNNIAFLIKARPDTINREVADALNDLGVVGIFLGIENASESGLKSLIRGAKIKDVYNALDVLNNYEIAVTFNLLIFHPNATLDEFNENIYFIKKNSNHPLDFGRAEIVAGSPLNRQVIDENLLRNKWPNWDYKIKDESCEKLFRINKVTFRKEGSNYSKLSHFLIALAYQAYTVNRFYKGPLAENLLSESNVLIVKSNEFILENLLKIYKLSFEFESKNDLDLVYNSIKKRSAELIYESEKLSNKMNRLQTLEKSFKDHRIENSAQNYKIPQKIFRI